MNNNNNNNNSSNNTFAFSDNPYEILGVSNNASEDDIKIAYHKAARKYHPDKQVTGMEQEQASAIFSKISDAYETLSDPVKRYDWRLKSEDHHQTTTKSSYSPRPTTPTRYKMNENMAAAPVTPNTTASKNTSINTPCNTPPRPTHRRSGSASSKSSRPSSFRHRGRNVEFETNAFDAAPPFSSPPRSGNTSSSGNYKPKRSVRTKAPPMRRGSTNAHHRRHHPVDYASEIPHPKPGITKHRRSNKKKSTPKQFVEKMGINL